MKETVTDPLLFFLVSILFGVCLQAIYDIIRGIRRVFYHKSVFLFIEDIGFGIFTAVMAFIFLCTYNDGELRGFFFLGIVIGMILYYQLCSKFLLRAVIHITEKLKKKAIWKSMFKTRNSYQEKPGMAIEKRKKTSYNGTKETNKKRW